MWGPPFRGVDGWIYSVHRAGLMGGHDCFAHIAANSRYIMSVQAHRTTYGMMFIWSRLSAVFYMHLFGQIAKGGSYGESHAYRMTNAHPH